MTARVLRFPHRALGKPAFGIGNPIDALTDAIVMKQAAAGSLSPVIVEALLMSLREPVPECGR